MIKYFAIRDFRGTCSLFICRNAEEVHAHRKAERVHGKQKIGNPALKVRSIKICRSLLRVPHVDCPFPYLRRKNHQWYGIV